MLPVGFSVWTKQMCGQEQGLPKMAAYDGLRVAHGGQVNASIPSQHHLYICRYTAELLGRQRCLHRQRLRSKKRLQYFGDAILFHAMCC